MRFEENLAQRFSGFTLIELSIVLVIIGLIIGGGLVGRDLLNAATIRAQLSQIEKYNTAVNTFRGKYGYLPGDIPDPVASQYGFAARGPFPGEGDGNGIIQGNYGSDTSYDGNVEGSGGETNMFWVDLTAANGQNINFIEGSFSVGKPTCCVGAPVTTATNPAIKDYLPQAKVGSGNYIYVYSVDAFNYYGLSAVSLIGGSTLGLYTMESTPGLTVQQAYNIDQKIDDGFPQSGNLTAQYVDYYPSSAAAQWAGAADTAATAGSSATCYDNSASTSGTPGVAGAIQHYSVEMNNGAGINCTLSFKFQ